MARYPQFAQHWSINISQATQFVWLMFVTFALSFVIPGIPAYLELLRTPCNGSGCFQAQLTAEIAQAWEASGATLNSYALVQLLILLTVGGMLLGTATLLIWRKPHHHVSALAAFVGTSLACSTLSQALAHADPRFWLPAQVILFIQIGGMLPLFCLFPDGCAFNLTGCVGWPCCMYSSACST
jgi:hypothetical protein